MIQFYTPVLLLQIFCLYHAYRNNIEQRWYWLIIFFPLGGSVIYLYTNFYNRRSINNLAEGLKEVVNTNYRIEQLEKELRFSDNVKNKMNLAEEYVKQVRYKEAEALYADCLSGFMADDPGLMTKLLQINFLMKDYEKTITYGDRLKSDRDFKNAEERIMYAMAFYFAGKLELAEANFKDMDKSFTNYKHRLEYSKFLYMTNRVDESKAKVIELLEEFEHLKNTERKLNREVISEAKEFYKGSYQKR